MAKRSRRSRAQDTPLGPGTPDLHMSHETTQPPDHYAKAYSSWFNPLHFFHKRRLDHVASIVPAGSRVLDVGCDSGVLATLLVAKGCRVLGVDKRRASIDLARQLCPQVEFQVHDIRELHLGRRFDVVVCADVLEHLEEADRQQSISHLLAHAKPGGLIVVTYPSRLYFAAEPLWRRLRPLFYRYTDWDDDLHIPIQRLQLPGCETVATGRCCLGLVVWTKLHVQSSKFKVKFSAL